MALDSLIEQRWAQKDAVTRLTRQVCAAYGEDLFNTATKVYAEVRDKRLGADAKAALLELSEVLASIRSDIHNAVQQNAE